MNKHLFRLVFNAARGQLMAVAEVASSHSGGKDAGGTTTLASGQSLEPKMPFAPMDIAQAAIKNIVYAVALLAAPAWLSTSAWAQGAPATTIVVNKGAPTNQQPVVTTTASGVTQVNIQAAVGGVSRNRYTQFDVGSGGLILNNSPVNSKTQIGGWVAGNNNLAAGSAGIILNEVNSSNPSQLRGYIEVAGQKAEVVIANPSGIAVNGGGFINASGATLTTGVPQFSGNTLTGYQVGSGTITVSGTGLDTANTGITTLQAKNIILQGGVFANDLRVKADNSTGTPGAVAIDVAAIGGMYANKITILATGLGAGVNNAGTLQANSGSFTLSADGTLTNTGTINSTATTRINAQTVNNSTGGAIFGGSVGIAATTLNNAAATSTSTAPVIAARDAAGRVDLGVQTLNNQEGALIYSAGSLAIGGSLDGAGQATGRATSITNNSATIEAASHVNITTQTLDNFDSHFAWNYVTTYGDEITEIVDQDHKKIYRVRTDTPTITAQKTAKIISGGDLTLDASTSATNTNSQILAAGVLHVKGASITNSTAINADTVKSKEGRSETFKREDRCAVLIDFPWGGSTCVSWVNNDHWVSTGYSQAISATPTFISQGVSKAHTASTPAVVPNSALFSASNNNRYLVETNPAFTNKQIWLSSDFMLSALSVDPDITQKRMGDGFYEQRLINEQVARLTGYARLANYSSDEQQYQALMTAGITMAAPLKLRVGIALTAAQVAQLTSDIVWLVQQEVTLKDGSKQKVLVPQVYAMTRSGDLSANGALLSGSQVKLDVAKDITNTRGTILGRNLVQLNAQNVRNLEGDIQAATVQARASQDIDVIGGTVTARNSMALEAGRDITVASSTFDKQFQAQAANTSFHGVSRVAGLYVSAEAGQLLASPGRDLTLTASDTSAAQTTLVAQRNVTFDVINERQTDNVDFGDGNSRHDSRTHNIGTTLNAGNLTVLAGGNIMAKAVQANASDTLSMQSGGSIILQAGTDTRDLRISETRTTGDILTQTQTQTITTDRTAKAVASTLGGKNVSIVAGENLVSVGTQFNAKDSLQVEGKNDTLLYATQDVHEHSVVTHSKTTLGAIAGVLGSQFTLQDKTTTDATASSTAVASKLSSSGAIRIGVGNRTELQGTEVEAPQIAFVKTDPTKAGELVLAGSTNTTQVSHTEKTETAGVYQEMKGKGSTTQTLNQTQIKGNVSFDSALKITAQIPDTKGGQELKSQINALVTQGNGVGLDYLNALASNPNVKWDKVALAHENWSYDQAGLTGAGAALLTIVVTYFTAGMGTAAVGGTAATAATATTAASAATVMGSTALATAVNAGFSAIASQAAVSMVNNKGDIGKTLDQLGKEESIKGLLTTMVTAGALDKLNTSYLKGVDASSKFGTQLLKNVTNNLASSAMDAALTGKPWNEDAISKALSSALVTTGMAQGANAIGDAASARIDGNGNVIPAQIDAFTQKLAHAVLGCAGGAATAGNASGCAPGAVGAVVGEITAEFAKNNNMSNADALGLSKVLAASSGVIVGGGGDNATAVNVAATTGANAAENNYLKHADLSRLAKLLGQKAAGRCDITCDRDIADLNALSARRNVATGDRMDKASVEEKLNIMAQLSGEMNSLATYKAELEDQLKTTRNPSARAALSLQINTADNSIRQIAGLGKDGLSMLYKQTGDAQYQYAFQTLVAATSGNELAAAWGSGGIAGMGNKTKTKVDVDKPVGAKETTGGTGTKLPTATDGTATSPYSSNGTSYGKTTLTDINGNALPTQPSLPKAGAKGGDKVADEISTTFSSSQLDKKFKHADDFGLSTTKKNPETLSQYQVAIESHLSNASTYAHGTYQYVPGSTVHFNPVTNNVVILGKDGSFVSGWKLAPGTTQFENFIKNGVLR